MMFRLNVPTKRGSVLNGVLFHQEEKKKTDTCLIAITGIHGNFYSNPFYYNIGDTLNSGNIDFIYAQTNDAYGQIETVNVNTGKKEPSVPGTNASPTQMRISMPTWALLRTKAMNTSSLPGTPLAPTR
jgi:hypothetical protein